jgi:effector-binding domain-containing protein
MKIFKRILIALLVIIVALLIFAAFLPSNYTVTRAVVINNTSENISKKIVDFQEWNNWSPWIGIDKTEKYTFNDTIGIGAKMEWTGDTIGEGNMTITGITKDTIKYDLIFMAPWKSVSAGSFSFAKADAGTTVTWTNKGELAWPLMRLMGFIMNFDKMMGPDFEKGLAKLKTTVENSSKYSYNIIEKDVPSSTIATVHNKIKMEEIADVLGKSYGSIQELMAKQGAQMAGAPMAITIAYDSLSWEFEAAIPIDKEIKGNDKVQVKKSYAGKVIYLSYMGPYNGTYQAYIELESYKKEKGYTDNGGPWEVYVTDPTTEPDTSKWITEIYFPVK